MALGSNITTNRQHHHPYQRPQTQHQLLAIHQKQPQPRAIAPAPHTLSAMAKASGEKYCGGAIGTTLDSNNPAVVRRNARERNRVKQVNNGFTYLRQHLPPGIIADLSNGRRGIGPGAHKKLSKVDTLRTALEYIRRLQHVIDEVDGKRAVAQTQTNNWSNMEISATNSPPPTPHKVDKSTVIFADKMQEHCQTLNYADTSLQQQQFINLKYQHQQLQQQYLNQYPGLISPAGSVSSTAGSDCNNSDVPTFYGHQTLIASATTQQYSLPLQMKYEQQYNDEALGSSSGDEEDLLDYISLWQDEV